jgi:hypothetical protein
MSDLKKEFVDFEREYLKDKKVSDIKSEMQQFEKDAELERRTKGKPFLEKIAIEHDMKNPSSIGDRMSGYTDKLTSGYADAMAKPHSVLTSAIRSTYTDDNAIGDDPLDAELNSLRPTEEGSFQKDLGTGAGLVADVALGLATGKIDNKILGKVASSFNEKSLGNIEKSLLRGDIGKDAARDIVSHPGVGEKSEGRRLSETVDRFGLTQYITDKTKLLRKIGGDIYKGVGIDNGLIKNLGDELSATISKLPNFSLGDTDTIPKLASDIKKRLASKMAGTYSGFEWNDNVIKTIDDTVDSFLKPIDAKYAGSDKMSSIRFENMNPDAKQLLGLKRAAQKQAYSNKKLAKLGATDSASKSMIYDEMWKTIDDYIYKIAEEHGGDSAEKIARLNRDMSDLLSLESVVKDAPTSGRASLAEMIVGSGAGYMAGSALGIDPMISAGAYPLVRGAVGDTSVGIPSVLGKVQGYISDTIKNRPNGSEYVAAIANSIAQFRIPRNTDQIDQNKDMVSAKLLKEVGPDAAQAFNSANSPDQQKNIIRTISMSRPDLFEQSKYNTIDGYIIDPVMKQVAMSDMIKDPGSSIQDAKKMQKLLHSGFIGE